ncbi:MAG: TlpA family protein disulfide reductase [Candidatus Dormibacteraceae bacterium]
MGTASFLASYVALWLLVALQAAVLLEVVRRLARLDVPVGVLAGRLPGGSEAPDFEAEELSSDRLLTSAELRGKRVLLSFVNTSCARCKKSLPAMRTIAERSSAELILVCSGERDACSQQMGDNGDRVRMLWDVSGAIGRQLAVTDVPEAVLIDEDWRILKYGRPGTEDDELLLIESVRSSEPAS